ncbi:hypothetical protein NBM05_15110, partial [Rothia sp. AR01]
MNAEHDAARVAPARGPAQTGPRQPGPRRSDLARPPRPDHPDRPAPLPPASVVVPARGPWDPGCALGILRYHAIPGLERHDAGARTHLRTLRLEGTPRIVEVRVGDAGVEAAPADGLGPLPASTAALLDWWFDLSAPIEAIDRDLAGDPVLGPLVLERPGVRATRCPDPFEAAVTTVLGQQVSGSAARTFAGRLVEAFGEPVGAV